MKNTTLFFGVIVLGLLLIDLLGSSKYCSFSCLQNFYGVALNLLVLFGGSLLILIILNMLPSRVYQRWWKFARWAIPVVLIISTLINSGIHHSPNGELQNIFDIPALILAYSVFVIGSIVQIWRGYRKGD